MFPPLDDESWVVRGGVCRPDALQAGTGPHRDLAGIYGFSVQSADGHSVQDLARAGKIPNGKIGVTRVRQVRALGYDVLTTPGLGLHATVLVTNGVLDDTAAEALSGIFEVRDNPCPYRHR